ncbi:hypothetical protein BGZ83_001603 [Gryganskiella cystojenkinii]|nr:hypothetical protein BGZ83_001603 [Gryganskiella cystojenkinii]
MSGFCKEMFRSLSSALVLTLVALQVVAARVLSTGTYMIEDCDGKLLGIGPVPPVYPPMDVPVRLFDRGSPFAERWLVREMDDGVFVISAGHGRPEDYKIVARNDAVFVSAVKTAETWSLDMSSKKDVIIRAPHSNNVFTVEENDQYAPLKLRQDEGQNNQRFKFIRIDRDDVDTEVLDREYRPRFHRELYRSDRFQETWTTPRCENL